MLAMANAGAKSAEIVWEAPKDDAFLVGTVYLKGAIEVGDQKKLLDALGDNEGQGKGYNLYFQLDSPGGSFEEAIKIAKTVKDKNLSTRLAAGSRCLSACSIIFMSGKSFNNSFFIKDRAMHPKAVLGFHAPTVQAQGGNFDAADLDDAYERAIEQVGKNLLAVARYRDESWSNPLIKPSLINEMMLKRGDNFFYIDTVGRAAEYEIQLTDAKGPSITPDRIANACKHAIASVADATVAEDAVEYWLHGSPTKRRSAEGEGTIYSFELNRAKGRFCEVDPPVPPTAEEISSGTEPYPGRATIGAGGEGAGGEHQMEVPPWFFWESDKKLPSLADE